MRSASRAANEGSRVRAGELTGVRAKASGGVGTPERRPRRFLTVLWWVDSDSAVRGVAVTSRASPTGVAKLKLGAGANEISDTSGSATSSSEAEIADTSAGAVQRARILIAAAVVSTTAQAEAAVRAA